MRLLIIEDDADIAGNIGDYLAARGHAVDFAYSGEAGLAAASDAAFDAILLDVNLPKRDGFAVCRTLRQDIGVTTPVVFLTARGDITDRLAGFEAGGWDYLVKPFSLAELSARLDALRLRDAPSGALRVGRLEIDAGARVMRASARSEPLANIALRILTALARAHPDAVSRADLVSAVWGEEEPDSAPLRSHVSELRARLDAIGAGVRLVALRGFGYRLEADDA